MKNSLFIFFILLLHISLKAHPSYGIVVTEANEIIFCDVLHHQGTIWKLDQKGNLSKLLTGEHCHFIFLGQEEQVWGTHHNYIEARDTNLNSLWRLVDGKKQVIIPPTDDPRIFSGVNFVVNEEGQIYYNAHRQLYVRDTNGNAQLLSPHKFGRIMSLQLAQDGQIIVVDNNARNGSLIKVSPTGDLTYLATGLLDPNPSNPPFEEARFNLLYAAFADERGNTFVANSGSRRISRVDREGRVEHLFHSAPPWYPVAYAEKNGVAYVMEMSFIPGIGNLGPQIQRLENGQSSVLVNIDASKMGKPGKRSGNQPDEEVIIPGRSKWFWYGLASVLLFVFLGRQLSKNKIRKKVIV